MFLKKKNENQISFSESTVTIKPDNRVKSLYSDMVMTIVSISSESEVNPFDRVVICKWFENKVKKEGEFKLVELRDAQE